jgi:hypothetical protein
MENSTKFMFLHKLFHQLRDSDNPKHLVLVTQGEDDILYNILETLCRAKYVNFSMPTRRRQADPNDYEGNLLVTIIPADASPTIPPANLIVCLDGLQEATQIRTKNWASSPNCNIVPVIHLVIPRTIGHIERCISPSQTPVERMHTLLARLAQVRLDIGKAIDEETPRAIVCGARIATWLTEVAHDKDTTWPLPPISILKDLIEYETPQIETEITVEAFERRKRLLVRTT